MFHNWKNTQTLREGRLKQVVNRKKIELECAGDAGRPSSQLWVVGLHLSIKTVLPLRPYLSITSRRLVHSVRPCTENLSLLSECHAFSRQIRESAVSFVSISNAYSYLRRYLRNLQVISSIRANYKCITSYVIICPYRIIIVGRTKRNSGQPWKILFTKLTIVGQFFNEILCHIWWKPGPLSSHWY
jgi:hypothetical protein